MSKNHRISLYLDVPNKNLLDILCRRLECSYSDAIEYALTYWYNKSGVIELEVPSNGR